MRLWLLFLACCPAWVLAAEAPALAAKQAVPIVVEMFTSKYCPSCPAAEVKMLDVAANNPDLLVIFAHVDYWDRGNRKDPLGLAEMTQRQYDYSNTLGRRPGEVFTPMPLLDGQWIATPPLWMSWETTVAEARAAPSKLGLRVEQSATGLSAAQPASLAKKADLEGWVLGLDRQGTSQVWNVRGIAEATLSGGRWSVAKALQPKGSRQLLLVQEAGPGAVLAVGWLDR